MNGICMGYEWDMNGIYPLVMTKYTMVHELGVYSSNSQNLSISMVASQFNSRGLFGPVSRSVGPHRKISTVFHKLSDKQAWPARKSNWKSNNIQNFTAVVTPKAVFLVHSVSSDINNDVPRSKTCWLITVYSYAWSSLTIVIVMLMRKKARVSMGISGS